MTVTSGDERQDDEELEEDEHELEELELEEDEEVSSSASEGELSAGSSYSSGVLKVILRDLAM